MGGPRVWKTPDYGLLTGAGGEWSGDSPSGMADALARGFLPPRNAWSLFNAFIEASKGIDQPRETGARGGEPQT